MRKTSMKILYYLVIVFLFQNIATAQVHKGSIAIIYLSEDKIIMAADSKGNLPNKPPVYNECKVSALGKHMVFLSVNLTAWEESAPGGVPSWNSTEEAHRAYERLEPISQNEGFVIQLANEWAKAVADDIRTDYRYDPPAIASTAENGVLTDALFGESRNNRIRLFWERITFHPFSLEPIQVETLTEFPQMGFTAAGKRDIFDEFTNLASPRAKREAEEWAKKSLRIRPEDRDLMKAIRLADLTVLYDQSGTVGGKIDALELRRGGEVRWKQRKDVCPAQ
jgi:hypothetical protein